MFGSENSIEPVRGELPVTVARGTGRPATRTAADEPPIREMTPNELASAARRQRGTAEPDPIGAAPEARRGFFRRRPVEAPKLDAVAQRHGLYIAEKRGTRTYYADYQQKREVMRADGNRISTKLDDKQAVTAVLDLAEARGWNRVRVRGTDDFKRETWVQAQVRGIAAEGYKPSATDQQEVERRKSALGPIQPAAPKTSEAATATKANTAVPNHPTPAATREKVVNIGQPERAAVAQATAATPKQASSTAAAPVAIQASTTAAKDQAKAPKPREAAQSRRNEVRQAADAYRATLIAAAPPQPSKPAQSETQGRRSSYRM